MTVIKVLFLIIRVVMKLVIIDDSEKMLPLMAVMKVLFDSDDAILDDRNEGAIGRIVIVIVVKVLSLIIMIKMLF